MKLNKLALEHFKGFVDMSDKINIEYITEDVVTEFANFKTEDKKTVGVKYTLLFKDK